MACTCFCTKILTAQRYVQLTRTCAVHSVIIGATVITTKLVNLALNFDMVAVVKFYMMHMKPVVARSETLSALYLRVGKCYAE
jgi:hypothetical protein